MSTDVTNSNKGGPGTFRVLATMRLMLDARDSGATKHADFNVLNQLIMRCRPDKMYSCYPSYRQLALDTRLSPRKVKDAVSALKAMGFITVIVRPNRSNVFIVEADKIRELAESNRAARKAAARAEGERAYGEFAAVLESQRAAHEPEFLDEPSTVEHAALENMESSYGVEPEWAQLRPMTQEELDALD